MATTEQELQESCVSGSVWSRGLCKTMDVELFFPSGTTGPALLQIAAAKAVCRTCDVSLDCLWEGIDEEYGIRGGVTEQDRRDLRRYLGLIQKPKGGYLSRPDRRPVVEPV